MSDNRFGEIRGGLYSLWGRNYAPLGDTGTVVYWGWDEIEPARGQYNWAKIDKVLDQQVKPAQVMILHHTSDWHDSGYWWDRTPSWVGAATIRLTSGTLAANVPDYRNAAWREALLDFVAAFGARYNGDQRVGSVIVATGLDGETQIVKRQGANWLPILNTQASGAEYRWGKIVTGLMDAYKQALPQKLLLLNNAPGAGRMMRADAAVARGIGLKHSGMIPDIDFYEGSDDALWAFMTKYSQAGVPAAQTPCWVESATGNGNREWMMWAVYGGLSHHPVGMDVHRTWFERLSADDLAWIAAHLNVTPETTPSVWTVLRDTEYPVIPGASGKRGDWEFWLHAGGGGGTVGERVNRADLPAGIDRADWRARQSRLVDGSMALTVAPGFACAPCEITVTVAGTGGELTIAGQRVAVPGDGAWHRLSGTMPSLPADLAIVGAGHYVQMIEIARGTITPTPPPSSELDLADIATDLEGMAERMLSVAAKLRGAGVRLPRPRAPGQ